MIFRIVALLALFDICGSAMGAESTIEYVALHDGRHIKVERTVYRPTEFKILDPFFGLPTMPRTETGGPIFSLKFKHPDTQETITWQGEQYYTPVLLDIVNGVPYLVVNGQISKQTEAIYGCPELPYFYLKYKSELLSKWLPVPVEKAPDVLRVSNLSQDSGNDGGYLQKIIPRTYEEWNYQYKNNHRNERNVWDCRPPLQPLPDVPLPKPLDVELETVESNDYIGTGRHPYEDYRTLWDGKGTITRALCAKFFRPPNPENLMLGERFIDDPTGNIRLPYSGPIPFPSGRMLEERAERYCDNKFVWFVAKHEERGKTIITKYTASGGLLYNIRMDNPRTADNNLARDILLDSFTSQNGYLYFYWHQDLPMPSKSPMQYPYRMTKFRFHEPNQESISK